jgi:hypothetical protein
VDVLRQAFERYKGMAFPEHPCSDALDTWLMELLEEDAFMAGIATTVLNGGYPQTNLKANAKILQEELHRIHVEDIADQEIYGDCEKRIEALIKVETELIRLGFIVTK